MVDDADTIGEHVRLLEVLSGQEHGHAVLGGQACDLLPQRRAALDVEARRRLVEEQNPRVVDEREREVKPTLHPTRVAADAAIGGLVQSDALEQLVAAPGSVRAREALERGLQSQVLAAGEHRVERGLLQRGTDRRAHLRALAHDVVAGDARGSRRGGQQRGQHQHRRGLSGAVGSEEAVDLARRYDEIDPVDGARPLAELADELRGFNRVVRIVRHTNNVIAQSFLPRPVAGEE